MRRRLATAGVLGAQLVRSAEREQIEAVVDLATGKARLGVYAPSVPV
ncbi:MAG: hypothetical protein R3F30_08550 [Planctomycetota bacterium]